MSKNLPAALATYLSGHATQCCLLVKIGPLPDASYRYFALLDQDVDYDDGAGVQTYRASTGGQVSAFVSSADLGVDNAEMDTLPPAYGSEIYGITEEQLKSGELDGVSYVVYLISYADTSLEHAIWGGGTIGEQRIRGTALINLEQRSITNKLKQNIVQVDSVFCRAIFGSQPLGTGGGVVEEKYSCGYDLTPEWVPFVVDTVHPTETDLIFNTADLGQADDYFVKGMVRFTTGDNAGQEREVSDNELDTDQSVTLAYGLPHPIQPGDEGEIRRGCNKLPSGCRTFWDTAWVLHYRGEPHQPSADASINLIGGAGIPGDNGGTGENPTGPTPPPPTPDGGGAGTPGTPTARTIGATVSTPSLTAGSAAAAANSTAINTAIGALPAGGGIIRIPAGEWYINTANPITLDVDNIRLDLATNNATLRAAYSSTVTAPATHRDVVRVDGANEWEIVGGQIIGYRDAWATNGGVSVHGISEWAHGIYVTGGSTAGTIKSITISKCVGDAISLGRSASDVWVDDVEGSNCRRQGLSTGASQVTVTNCNFHHIGGSDGTAPMAGIDVEVDAPNSASDITISDTILADNTGPGLICWLRTSDITLTGLTVERNKNHGILLHDSDTGSITGCTIAHNKYYGIRAESNADGWTVSGNEFFNNQTAMNGTVTTGNTTTLTGTSTATRDHIQISSDSSVTVGSNEYGPT